MSSFEKHKFSILTKDSMFLPSDRCFIIPLEIYGVVVGVYMSMNSLTEYKVRYWLDEDCKEQYFYDFELGVK